jgi:hypothetical protein
MMMTSLSSTKEIEKRRSSVPERNLYASILFRAIADLEDCIPVFDSVAVIPSEKWRRPFQALSFLTTPNPSRDNDIYSCEWVCDELEIGFAHIKAKAITIVKEKSIKVLTGRLRDYYERNLLLLTCLHHLKEIENENFDDTLYRYCHTKDIKHFWRWFECRGDFRKTFAELQNKYPEYSKIHV